MSDARPITHLDARLKNVLRGLSSSERESNDTWGNTFYWTELNSPDDLPAAAAALAEHGARLCMLTALTRSVASALFLEYHFAVGGATVTLIVSLKDDQGVPSITRWFRNADWHEREAAELHGVKVRDNPTPRRLFLDPSLDEGVLRQIVPLTVMMNGACSKDLWERVMIANQETDTPKGSPAGGSTDQQQIKGGGNA